MYGIISQGILHVVFRQLGKDGYRQLGKDGSIRLVIFYKKGVLFFLKLQA